MQRDPYISVVINAYFSRNGACNRRLVFIYFTGFRIQAAYAIIGNLRKPDTTATVDRKAVRPNAPAGFNSIRCRVKRELAGCWIQSNHSVPAAAGNPDGSIRMLAYGVAVSCSLDVLRHRERSERSGHGVQFHPAAVWTAVEHPNGVATTFAD